MVTAALVVQLKSEVVLVDRQAWQLQAYGNELRKDKFRIQQQTDLYVFGATQRNWIAPSRLVNADTENHSKICTL